MNGSSPEPQATCMLRSMWPRQGLLANNEAWATNATLYRISSDRVCITHWKQTYVEAPVPGLQADPLRAESGPHLVQLLVTQRLQRGRIDHALPASEHSHRCGLRYGRLAGTGGGTDHH